MRTIALFALALAGCPSEESPKPTKAQAGSDLATPLPPWETANPVVLLPKVPLGVQGDYKTLAFAVTPEKVRLGRWLFFEKRLSADASISCASCHRPENAFSEPTPHSKGVGGHEGNRKAPTFVNGAWPLFPVFFWDGRAPSLIEQAKGPIANPIEMAMTHEKVSLAIAAVPGYRRAFASAFGDDHVTIDRIAEAIAAYESTRVSGNSAFDRFDAGDTKALSPEAARGRALFFGKAQCNQCHFGWNFTDSQFHNLGIGWDKKKKAFADVGRAKISGKKEDTGAFKTPTLREVSRHAPYMHDGSLATLRDVVQHYDKGGIPNPWLDKKVFKLKLSAQEVDDVVAFLKSLDGEGWQDSGPTAFPE